MLAIPMLGLFELGMFCARFYIRKEPVELDEEDEDESTPSSENK